MQRPKVAVVILNWNGKAFLQKFLPSVTETTYRPLDLYIADNASTDDSIAFVNENFKGIKILPHKENKGFAGGYNEALSRIEADYYVLLNQDVEVTPGWIEPVIELMEKDPTTAACQPKIKSWHHPEFFEYAGASGGWIDRYGYPFCRGRIFSTVEKDKGQYDEPRPVFWASGAALFVRAEVYQKSGGLDDHFFAHMEEIDLCWRIQRLGYRIMVCPQSVIYHVGGGSLEKGNPRKIYLNFRNNLIMLYKNLPQKDRGYTLFIRRILDGVAACRSLFQGNWKEIESIWKAHRDFRKWKKEHKKDKDPLTKIPFFNLPGVYRDSIIWQYFIQRKKTFQSLPE